MRRLWYRLRSALGYVLNRRTGDRELSEEIGAFVEHDADSKIRSGMTPEDARRAALIELGGAEQVKERVREVQAGVLLDNLARDIRYSLRSLGQARGFSLSVVGSLSLGLAATIVAFAFINGALFGSFPGVRDQDRLVEVEILENTLFGPQLSPTALADYPEVFRALNEGIPSLEDLASFTDSDVAVGLPEPRSLRAAFVSGNYFDVLGVRPEIGRTFAPAEGGAGSAVAVIAYGLWTREFGGDPSVIGRPIQTGGQSLEIIGVAPPGFRGTSPNAAGGGGVDLWLPMALAELVPPGSPGLQPGELRIRYLGRMPDGVPC